MSAFLCMDSNDPHVILIHAVFTHAPVFVSNTVSKPDFFSEYWLDNKTI